MAISTSQTSHRFVRSVGYLAASALVTYLAYVVRQRIKGAMFDSKREQELDRDLESTMDASDSVAKY